MSVPIPQAAPSRLSTAAKRFEATLPDRRGKPPSTGPTFHELASAYVVAKVGSKSTTDQDNTYYKLEHVILPKFGDLPAFNVIA